VLLFQLHETRIRPAGPAPIALSGEGGEGQNGEGGGGERTMREGRTHSEGTKKLLDGEQNGGFVR
jgi:hypothetical protein